MTNEEAIKYLRQHGHNCWVDENYNVWADEVWVTGGTVEVYKHYFGFEPSMSSIRDWLGY